MKQFVFALALVWSGPLGFAAAPDKKQITETYREACGGENCSGCTNQRKNEIEDSAKKAWDTQCDTYCTGFEAPPQCWDPNTCSKRGGGCVQKDGVWYWEVTITKSCKCTSRIIPKNQAC